MVATLFLVGVLFNLYFHDVTPAYLKENSPYQRSALVGDFDGDGDRDVFLCSPLPGESKFLENVGNLSFFEVTDLWGLDLTIGFKKAVMGDLNRDGYPDLIFVVNLPNAPLRIFINSRRRHFRELKNSTIQSYSANDVYLLDWNGDGYNDILISYIKTTGERSFTVFVNEEGKDFRAVDLNLKKFVGDSSLSITVIPLMWDEDSLSDLVIRSNRGLVVLLNHNPPETVNIGENLENPYLYFQKGAFDRTPFLFSDSRRRVIGIYDRDNNLQEYRIDEDSPLPVRAEVSDIDLDGNLEIVGVDSVGTPIILREDKFSETFSSIPTDLPKEAFCDLTLGDLDGDKAMDIILVGLKGALFLINTGRTGHYVEFINERMRGPLRTKIYSRMGSMNFTLVKGDNLLGLGNVNWIDSLFVESAGSRILSLFSIPPDTSITLPALQVEESGFSAVGLDTSVLRVFPNPSTNTFNFTLSLDTTSEVELQVISTSGAVIQDIASGLFEPGEYSFSWDPSKSVPGVYLLRVTVDQKTYLKKLILLR